MRGWRGSITTSARARTFFFRWADDSQREEDNRGIFGSTPFPIAPQYRKKPGSSWSWNLINVISPTTTNEAIFTYNHLTQVVDIVEDTPTAQYDRQALGFTFSELYPGVQHPEPPSAFQLRASGPATSQNFPSNWLSEGKTFAFTEQSDEDLRLAHDEVRHFLEPEPQWPAAIVDR